MARLPRFRMLVQGSPARPMVAWTILVLWGLAGTSTPPAAQICPPAPGVPLPEAALQLRREHPDAFELRHGWLVKTRQVAAARDGSDLAGKSAGAVEGTLSAPVFAVTYANTPAPPFPAAGLQTQLFGAGPGTVTAYYEEVSGGRLEVHGDVHGWHTLAQDDIYYEGSSFGLNPATARTGELLQETLVAFDGVVDFGEYDNDGPDGVPNSGDDDGYVDFVAFIHAEAGSECGGNENLWSHRWIYSAWPTSGGSPFLTDDVSASGGPILVEDYSVQPALDCDGVSMVGIGIFCHEFGHVFGIPDLYDLDGGSQGLGFWGLMASGNWNEPSSPAHMCAWTKQRLGWVNTLAVSWQGANLSLPSVQSDPTVVELTFFDERWRRREDCTLAGTASLAVGLSAGEASARGWLGGPGYGNRWRQTVAHDFHSDGSGPVVLSFEYAVDTESGYDFAFVLLEIEQTESVLAVYAGRQQGIESIDLTSALGGSPVDYRLKFRLVSNTSRSHEDGALSGGCAPFLVDHISLVGGGASHFADFESHRQGWYSPRTPQDNPIAERWLLEHRRREGFDQHLPGEGLLIYHVDEDVAWSASGNTGGSSGQLVHGVALEEADGQYHLMTAGPNRGDEGDVWPGATSAQVFDPQTVPGSLANGGAATRVAVRGIQEQGELVLCSVEAGDPPPQLEGVFPDSVAEPDFTVTLQMVGADGVQPGARIVLRRTGQEDLEGLVRWEDYHVVSADFDVSPLAGGIYDVVVENPDGQTTVATAAFTREGAITAIPSPPPAATVLHQNVPNPFNPRTQLRYELAAAGPVTLCVVDARGRRIRTLVEGHQPAGIHQTTWDGIDEQGRRVASGLYFAHLRTADGILRRKMLLLQ